MQSFFMTPCICVNDVFVPLIMFAAWFWHSFSLSHDNLFSLFIRWKPIKHPHIRESYTALEKTPSWFQFAGIFLPRQLKGSSKKTFIRGRGAPVSKQDLNNVKKLQNWWIQVLNLLRVLASDSEQIIFKKMPNQISSASSPPTLWSSHLFWNG